MGGVAGHMSHLYDNPNLRFSQMMDIFKAASNGELEGTEKTDGQNLFVGYNVAEGKAKAARNKSNVRTGGLDAAGLAQKFAGRGTVEQAFNEAFQTFELAAQSLPRKTQKEIFGDGVNNIIFYNAEIQDPRNANVINYDTKLLNIHRVGHFAVNLETGEVIDIDIAAAANKLENSLEHMQWTIANQEFRVQMNAIRRLEGLSDDRHLHNAIVRLNRALDDAGVSDNQTVGEYTIARLMPIIRNQVSLPEDKESLLIKKMLGVKGINIRDIKKDLNTAQSQSVMMLVSNAKAINQTAIQPLEDIIHDFSVEMIRNLKSAFVLDQDAEVKRLRAETDRAIRGIEASGNEEAMEILRKQMQKLKTIEDVSTAAEGFVFDYDGYTYKFTGNFAPMNQLLGLFKYGRGNIPPMQLSEEAPADFISKKKVALIAGGFRPPHRGHVELVKDYANKVGPGGDIVVFMSTSTNPKTMRYIGNDKTLGNPISVEQSLEIWKIYLKNEGLEGRVDFILTDRGPIAEVVDLIKASNPEDVEYFLAAGAKDSQRYNFMLDNKKYNPNNVSVNIDVTPTVVDNDGFNMSATRFRSALSLRDPEKDMSVIRDYIPTNSENDIDQILSLLGVSNNDFDTEEEEKKTLTLEFLFSLVSDVIKENKDLNPWAICTSKVGRENKDKYEKCVRGVKAQHNIEEDLEEGFGEGTPPEGEIYKKQVIELEEISAMAAGAVEGGPSSGIKKELSQPKRLVKKRNKRFKHV